MNKPKNRHYRIADKVIHKWKGGWTKQRVNLAIDETTAGLKESIPKYKRFYRKDGTYFLINLHDMLA